MSSKVKISVIIPTYNRSQLLREAVESVLQQTYQNFEIIIVDDASTDDTEGVVKKLMASDSRIRYYRQETNKRAPAARNRGLHQAKGDYIQFLDSDDLLLSEKFKVSMAVFEKQLDLDAVITQSQFFGDQKGIWGALPNPKAQNLILAYVRGDFSWSISGPLWRKAFLQEIGGFKEDLWASQESELHLRALCFSLKLYFIKEAYVKVRIDHKIPAMRKVFSNDQQRKSSFKALSYNYKLLQDQKYLNPKLHHAFLIKTKYWFRLALIENKFELCNQILRFLLQSQCRFSYKIRIVVFGYPILTFITFTGKGKNVCLKLINA